MTTPCQYMIIDWWNWKFTLLMWHLSWAGGTSCCDLGIILSISSLVIIVRSTSPHPSSASKCQTGASEAVSGSVSTEVHSPGLCRDDQNVWPAGVLRIVFSLLVIFWLATHQLHQHHSPWSLSESTQTKCRVLTRSSASHLPLSRDCWAGNKEMKRRNGRRKLSTLWWRSWRRPRERWRLWNMLWVILELSPSVSLSPGVWMVGCRWVELIFDEL